MTANPTGTNGQAPTPEPPGAWSGLFTPTLMVRLLLTALLVAGHYALHRPISAWLNDVAQSLAGTTMSPNTLAVISMAGLIALLLAVWRKPLAADKRFHAPVLITSILAIGDASYGILETHHPAWLAAWTGGRITGYSPTFVCILCTLCCELVLARYYYGKWPHLASAYISGISAGILIKSPALWPFLVGGMLSISSKYVLRLGNRHLWNPTNFGITMLLFLAPNDVAPLSVQAGNTVWAVLVIWILGGMIMYRLGLFHIPFTFLAAFIPLAFLRSQITGDPWLTELAPITFPMFQLFIFFMITDPKTIPRARRAQVLEAVVIAVVETVLRLVFKDVYSLFHSLFIVGPIANVIEIWHDRRVKKSAAASMLAGKPVEAVPAPGLAGTMAPG